LNGGDYESWDWTDYAIRSGKVQNYDLSLNSGSEKSQVYASVNYYNQTGIMINSDLERYNLRLNSDHKVTEKLKFGQTLTVSRTSVNTVGNLDANNNTRDWMRRLLLMNPYKRPYNEAGDYAGTSDFYDPQLDHDNYHALWALEQLFNHTDNTRFLSSIYGEWEFVKDLTFRSSLSIDWSTAKNEQRSPNMFIEGNATTDKAANSLSFNQSDNQTWLIENTLNYNKTFNDHSITALAGYQAQNGIYKGFNAGDSYFVDSEYWFFSRPVLMKDILDSQGNIVTSIPQTLPTVGNYQSESSVVSWFGRLFYSYKDRYLLTATLRHDASSKFGSNKRWGNFPAVNVGWRITEEDFMDNQQVFSNLKLRMGYGISGSDNVPNYQFQSTVAGGSDYNYVFNEGRVEGYTLNRLANSFLQWENIRMSNIGIDAGFFENRLSVVIDGYQKNTEKLFLSFAPPMEVGLESNPSGNLGEVQNTGLEFDINGNILNGPFKWNSNLNFSTVRNKVISLAADGADRFNGVNITRVGEEIGAIYGYVHDGLFQNWDEVYNHAYQKQVTTGAVDENGLPVYDTSKRDIATGLNFTAPGDIRFKDLNGDGIIEGENDRTIIGSTIPDFIWGWNNELNYQGFSLSIFFQGVHGIDLYNSLKAGQERTDLGFANKRATVLDAWSDEGSTNFYHRQTLTDPNINFRTSSRYIEDGSYIRLKNIRLTYDLPETVVSSIGIKNAQVYVNATNLLTFTKYTGYDPEIGLRNSGSPETAGVDAGVYPVTTMFTGGIKVTF
jgi:TonB-linked SusC/RagA family outer membrane protein